MLCAGRIFLSIEMTLPLTYNCYPCRLRAIRLLAAIAYCHHYSLVSLVSMSRLTQLSGRTMPLRSFGAAPKIRCGCYIHYRRVILREMASIHCILAAFGDFHRARRRRAFARSPAAPAQHASFLARAALLYHARQWAGRPRLTMTPQGLLNFVASKAAGMTFFSEGAVTTRKASRSFATKMPNLQNKYCGVYKSQHAGRQRHDAFRFIEKRQWSKVQSYRQNARLLSIGARAAARCRGNTIPDVTDEDMRHIA